MARDLSSASGSPQGGDGATGVAAGKRSRVEAAYPVQRKAEGGGQGGGTGERLPFLDVVAAQTPEPAPRRLAPGEPYVVGGTAAKPEIVIGADWVAQNGVARGFTGRITADTHPPIVRPIVEGLAAVYPWVAGRADKPLERIGHLGFEITADLWTDGEQDLGVDRDIFLVFGLPPTAPVQAFSSGDGVDIYVDSLYTMPPDGKPDDLERARKQLARDSVDAVEKLIGSPVDAAVRTLFEAQLDRDIAGQSDTVKWVFLDSAALTTYFGEKAVEGFTNGQAAATGDGAVITVPGMGKLLILAKDEEERKRVIALLEEIFGAIGAGATGDSGKPINFRDIEALFALDGDPRRAELIAMLAEMAAAPGDKSDPDAWNAGRIRDVIANAREQLEMRDADKKLGRAQKPMETSERGILPYPVPGDIINLSKEIQLGMRAEFEFRSKSTDDPREWHFGDPSFFHVSTVNVHWFALRVDDAGAPIGKPEAEERVDYIEIREDSWRNDKRFEHTFEQSGRYEIHADVVHSKFQPAHFSIPIEVVTEAERLRRMEHQGSEGWGTEVSREDKVFRGVDDNRGPWNNGLTEEELDARAHEYARGSRAEGRLTDEVALDPAGGVWKERDRLDAQILELETLEAHYSGDDSRSEAMREQIRERRERLETSLERVRAINEDAEVRPVQIEAHYASRTHGVPTATMNLVSFFRRKDKTYEGELLDNSELLRSEHFRFRQEDDDFEKMMEKLFDDLTETYPDGSISFAFQMYDGMDATDRFVRFTRKTDTVGKDIVEAAYDDTTRIVVNLISLILSLFPPTMPLGVALGLIYNGLDVLNTLDEAQRTDTMTTAKYVDAGLLALDILPALGALSKTTKIGSKVYHLIEATQLAGDVYLLEDGIQEGILHLRDGLIAQLAGKQTMLNELRRTNSSSPEAAQLQDEIRGLESEIRGAAGKVFTEVVTNQGLQMASQAVVRHIAGDLFARRPGDDDDDTRVDDDDGASGTRGKGVYRTGDAGSLGEVTFHNALEKLPNRRPNAKYGSPSKGKGVLTVIADDGTETKVDVEYVLAPLDPARAHDGDAGPGAVVLTPPGAGSKRWTATVTVANTLKHKSDVEHVVGHELDEVVEIVRRVHDDPSTDVAREHEASLFRPGEPGTATPSAHDIAAARELDGLFEAARTARDRYAEALARREDTSGAGTSIPTGIHNAHANAVNRLQNKLEAMGFAPGEDATRAELAKKYATHPDELAAFIDQYVRDPAAQRPDASAMARHVLHAGHAEQLDALGIDKAKSAALLDKGISGPAMIEVAQKGGVAGIELLDRVAIDRQNATNSVEMVKAVIDRGQLAKAEGAAGSLSRFSSENVPIHEVLDRLDTVDADRFDALSWLVGSPDRNRRIKLPVAEEVLKVADEQGVGPKVVELARSGKLRNPQKLAAFVNALSGDYGNRYMLDVALEHVASNEVTLDGGKADLVVHGAGGSPDTAMQGKFVNSPDERMVNQNVYDAVEQLRGGGGEGPDPGSIRVAKIVIDNRDNPRYGKSKPEQIEGLKKSPEEYGDLNKAQADGTVGWEQIEIRTDGATIIILPGDL